MAEDRKLATIMGVDVAGYSRAAEANESAAAEAVARLRDCLDHIVEPLGGRVFSTAGDGMMAELPSASAGVEAVMALLEECRVGAAPKVRIGLHMGEVIVAGADLLGHGVNVAARLQSLAEPGTAVVSRAVQSQLHSGESVPLVFQGKVQLDKMSERIGVYTLAPERRFGFARIFWKRSRGLVFALLALVAVGVAGFAAWRTFAPQRELGPPVLAVLPFDAETPEAAAMTQSFSTGLHQMLASPDIRLISAALSFPYGDPERRLAELRTDLHADYVLDGTISRAGPRFTINAELTDVRSGVQVWRDTYDGDMSRLAWVQAQINVSARSALLVVSQAASRGREVDPVALRLFLSAWAHNPEGVDIYASHAGAMDSYQRATEVQPDFTTAWSDLARVAAVMQYRSPTQAGRTAARELGLSASKRVVELMPSDPFALVAQTQYCDWIGDREGYRRAIARAVEADRGHPITLSMEAYELARLGRAREAVPIAVRSRELDAFSLYAFSAPDPVEYLDTPAQFEDLILTQGISSSDPPSHWRAIHLGWLALGDMERAARALASFDEAVALINRNRVQMSEPYAEIATRWLAENHALDAAMRGRPAARAALATEYQRRADARPLAFRHDATAVEFYNFVLPALALTGGADAAYAAWEARLARLPKPDGHWVGDGALEHETFIFNETMFRPMMHLLRADPRFWRMIARMEFPDWWIGDARWPPDFCSDPDLGYDCTMAMRYALDEVRR